MQTTLSFANKKNRDCSKGYPCGASCISKTRNCGKKLNPTAKAYLGYLQTHANRAQADNFDVFRKNRVQAYLAQKRSPFKALVQPLIPIGTPVPGTPSAFPPPAATPPAGTKKTKKTTKKTASLPGTTGATTGTTAPQTRIRFNSQKLQQKRDELIQAHGQQAVEAAEAGLRKTIAQGEVYIAVNSAVTLDKIIGSRFKNSFETGSEPSVPGMKGTYAENRKRVEKEVMGIDDNTSDSDRPIYGYLASDLAGDDQATIGWSYGGIAIKLKPSVKDSATFTGSDSFKSGIASPLNDPNAASVMNYTRHGHDVDGVMPRHLSAYGRKAWQADSLNQKNLGVAKHNGGTDNIAKGVTPSGNAYMEVQIHRQVTPSDIAEIHYTIKGKIQEKPTADVVDFAIANGVSIFINGKKADLKKLQGQAPRLGDTSNRADHKPNMSDADALEYTKNSLVKNTVFLHGTRAIAAKDITDNGIDPKKNTTAVYGRGFYMTRSTWTAQSYASQAGGKGVPTIVKGRVDVRNPFIVKSHSDMDRILKTSDPDKITAKVKKMGYDSVYVEASDYWVLQDPKQLVVIN